MFPPKGPGAFPPAQLFLRGDPDGNGTSNIGDPIVILGWLMLGDAPMPCLTSADANDDGTIDISDPITILRYLYLGEGSIEEPSGACGLDPTPDDLGCEAYPPCGGA